MNILPIRLPPINPRTHILASHHPSSSKEFQRVSCFARRLHTFNAVTTSGRFRANISYYKVLLACCCNLRVLDLSVSFGDLTNIRLLGRVTFDWVSYRAFIWHLSWPHLNTFKIAGRVVIEAEDLLTFLRRHRGTLKYLSLSDLCLLQYECTLSWIDVVEKIRASMLAFQTFRLVNLHERYWVLREGLPHLFCEPRDPQAEAILDGADCAFRRGYLDVLERRVLDGVGAVVGKGEKERGEELEIVRKEWHDFKQMPCWADPTARARLEDLGYIA